MSALLLQEFPLRKRVEEGAPRPEYPQPQFEREDWLNLNGTWEFEFDDANAGLREHWAVARPAIQPPHCGAVLF